MRQVWGYHYGTFLLFDLSESCIEHAILYSHRGDEYVSVSDIKGIKVTFNCQDLLAYPTNDNSCRNQFIQDAKVVLSKTSGLVLIKLLSRTKWTKGNYLLNNMHPPLNLPLMNVLTGLRRFGGGNTLSLEADLPISVRQRSKKTETEKKKQSRTCKLIEENKKLVIQKPFCWKKKQRLSASSNPFSTQKPSSMLKNMCCFCSV